MALNKVDIDIGFLRILIYNPVNYCYSLIFNINGLLFFYICISELKKNNWEINSIQIQGD